jgi:hypothetical protein
MMMGGADIVDIGQKRLPAVDTIHGPAEVNVDVHIAYNLRQIGNEALPKKIVIQILSQESGDVVFDEMPNGTRQPARTGFRARRAADPGHGTLTTRDGQRQLSESTTSQRRH